MSQPPEQPDNQPQNQPYDPYPPTPPSYGQVPPTPGAYDPPPTAYDQQSYQPYGQPAGQQPYQVPSYGYGQSPYPVAPTRQTNNLAVASMVVSIVSLVGLFLCCVGGLAGVAGAIMGHIARGQIKRQDQAGGGMALAGIIIGWIAVGLTLAFAVVLVVILSTTDNSVHWDDGATTF